MDRAWQYGADEVRAGLERDAREWEEAVPDAEHETDEAAFLAAIRAAPCDEAPRLAFADWLDERGRESEAEWLRADIRLAGAKRGERPFLAFWAVMAAHMRPHRVRPLHQIV